jgi:hypothetical protein
MLDPSICLPSHSWYHFLNQIWSPWKIAFRFLVKSNMQLAHDPTIPLLGINPKEMKAGTHTDIHSSMITKPI